MNGARQLNEQKEAMKFETEWIMKFEIEMEWLARKRNETEWNEDWMIPGKLNEWNGIKKIAEF